MNLDECNHDRTDTDGAADSTDDDSGKGEVSAVAARRVVRCSARARARAQTGCECVAKDYVCPLTGKKGRTGRQGSDGEPGEVGLAGAAGAAGPTQLELIVCSHA